MLFIVREDRSSEGPKEERVKNWQAHLKGANVISREYKPLAQEQLSEPALPWAWDTWLASPHLIGLKYIFAFTNVSNSFNPFLLNYQIQSSDAQVQMIHKIESK